MQELGRSNEVKIIKKSDRDVFMKRTRKSQMPLSVTAPTPLRPAPQQARTPG